MTIKHSPLENAIVALQAAVDATTTTRTRCSACGSVVTFSDGKTNICINGHVGGKDFGELGKDLFLFLFHNPSPPSGRIDP